MICQQFKMEARVGIGRFTQRLQPHYARFDWQFKLNRLNSVVPFLTPLVSVLVSAIRGHRAGAEELRHLADLSQLPGLVGLDSYGPPRNN